MPKRVRISLATKFTLAFASLIVVTMGVIVFAVRQTTISRFTGQYEGAVTKSLQSVQAELRDRKSTLENRLAQLGRQLRADNNFRLQVLVRGNLHHPDVIDYAQRHLPATGLDVLEIANSEGVVLSSAHDRTSFGKKIGGLANRLIAHPQEINLAVFEKDGEDVICLSGALFVAVANRNFFLIGGVAVDSTFLNELSGSKEEILILDLPETRVISSPTAEKTRSALAALDASEADPQLFSSGQVPLLLHSEQATEQATLYTLHPKTELTNLLAALNRRILLIGGIGLALAVLLSVLLARSVSRPLRRLAKTASGLSLQKLDAEFELNGNDEVAVLNDALDEMQHGLRKGRLELAAAEKKAAFAQIARQVNHDIKNGFIPIRNVMKHWQRVAESEPQNLAKIFSERKSSVLESVDYLENLARSYSRLKPAVNLTSVDVNQVIRNLLKNYDSGDDTSVAFRTQLHIGQTQVQADSVQLYRAFENILLNAVEAMDGNGVITITTSVSEGQLTISWKDTGPGIPEEIRDQLFRPHVTTKQGGTGLGLVNVKSIIEDFGGQVKIESEVGVGTVVRITLPVAQPLIKP